MSRRKTDTEFKAEVKALVGDEYTVLGKYVTGHTKIKIRHNKCKFVFKVRPASFLFGSRCPNCAKLKRNKTEALSQIQFENRVEKKQDHRIKVIGKYKNYSTKILIQCRACGWIGMASPASLIARSYGTKCPLHGTAIWGTNRQRISQDEFIKKVNKAQHNQYLILSKYHGVRSMILVQCKICGQKGFCNAENLENQHLGKNCNHNFLINDEIFKERVNKKQKGRIKVLGKYHDSSSNVLVQCTKCGHKWYAYASNLLHNELAVNCSHHFVRYSREEIKQKISKASHNSIQMIGKYHGASKKALMKCLKCGHKWFTSPVAIYGTSNNGCPNCVRSKCEEMTSWYLKKKHFTFLPQYTFSNCRDKLPLPFDFAVFNSNGTLNCLIEVQGAQHFFKPNDGKNHAYFNVHQINKHDHIKYIYCKQHHIKLIYINHPEQYEASYHKPFLKHLVITTLDRELQVK